eukprot:8543303-Heterocapsa_arctica.AAC.1
MGHMPYHVHQQAIVEVAHDQLAGMSGQAHMAQLETLTDADYDGFKATAAANLKTHRHQMSRLSRAMDEMGIAVETLSTTAA